MNKEKAQELIDNFGFSNTEEANEIIAEIENKKDQELITEWKTLTYSSDIIGTFSFGELQKIGLIELEILDRENINIQELVNWYIEQKEAYEKNS